MACSSDRIGHDIVLLSMPPIFRGTLDVLSLVPGTHLPVKASRFHPQFPAFRLIRPGARHRTASSLTFQPTRSGAPAQNGILPDQGCRNVECIPDRRDQVILIPPYLGRFSERLE